MADIPDWVEDRLNPNLNNKLDQRHVVETMLEADRPFFSISQLQSRLKPDVGRGTVRNRLDELQEIDIVAVEEYPDTMKLYYVDHPESEWPLGPAAKEALVDEEIEVYPSAKELVTFRNEMAMSRLMGAGLYLSLLLLTGGAFLAVAGFDDGTTLATPNALVTAGMVLMFFLLALSIGQLLANGIRRVVG